MALTRRLALFFLVIALMPLWASAQQDDAALREAIRADIMADPRSSGMTEAEIEAMVDALAVEAEERGTAATYLEARNTTFDTQAPVYEPPLVSTSNALAIAAVALLAVLGGVTAFLVHNRRKAKSII